MTDIYLNTDWAVLSVNVVSTGTAITYNRRLTSFTVKNTSDIEIYLYKSTTDTNPFVIYPREWHSFIVDVSGKSVGDYIYGYLRTDSVTATAIPIIVVYRA